MERKWNFAGWIVWKATIMPPTTMDMSMSPYPQYQRGYYPPPHSLYYDPMYAPQHGYASQYGYHPEPPYY